MDSFWEVSRLWSYRSVQSRREESDQAARRFTSAISAEDRLATEVRNKLGYDGIRMRIRVPRLKQEDSTGGRAEIDMIVVTGRNIFIVEVKNWFGDVYTAGPNDDHWVQCPPHPVNPRAHGNPIDHGDILGDLKVKTRAFIDYLFKASVAQQTNLKLPFGCIVPLVVFVNDQARLDPKTQQRHPHAMTLPDFLRCVGEKVAWWDWCSWAFPWVVPTNELTHFQQLTALAAIDTLPTWDVITLHNGTVRTGDVLAFLVPEASRRAQWLRQDAENAKKGGGPPAQAPVIQRQNVASARVTWPGTGMFGLAWTLAVGNDRPAVYLTMKDGAGGVPSEMNSCGFVLQGNAAASASETSAGAVGSPMSRRQRQQQQLRVGNANADEQPPVVVRIPLGSKISEPLQSRNVVHLTFKSAGCGSQSEPEVIALHHIASLELSAMHHWADRQQMHKTPSRAKDE